MAREPRVSITFRIGRTGRNWLDDLVVETNTDLTTVVRACCLIARRHEPELKNKIKEMNQA